MDRMTGIETQALPGETGTGNENRSNMVHWLIAGLLGISRMEAEQIAGAAAHLANGLKRRARSGIIGRNSVLKAIEVVFFLVSLGASSASAGTLTVTGTVDYRALHPTRVDVYVLTSSGVPMNVGAGGTSTGTRNFTATIYCNPGDLLYFVTGMTQPAIHYPLSQPQIYYDAEIALETCSNLSSGSGPNIVVNELTTVAAAYALAGDYFDAEGNLSGNRSHANLRADFNQAIAMVDPHTGQATAALTQNTLALTLNRWNTLANALADCIWSTGASSSQCGQLFSSVSVPGVSQQPTNTIMAALQVAFYPLAVNSSNVFNTGNAYHSFTPWLQSAPADWSSQLNMLADKNNVIYQKFQSDQFSWYDSAGEPRTATLAHNNSGCFYGSCGGELRDFQYVNNGAVLDAAAPTAVSNGDGGFGYVVSHAHQDPEAGTVNSFCAPHAGKDTSQLGHQNAGQSTLVFLGRHHALYDFTQDYARYCPQSDEDSDANCIGTPHGKGTGNCGAKVNNKPLTAAFQVPVTIGWLFSTGNDNPVWSVTYDIAASGAKNGDLEDDTRAPYGALLWDGSPDSTNASGEMNNAIAGTAWSNGWDFTTTPQAGPMTLESAWTWNHADNVAYSGLWTSTVDAAMGVVQTQTLDLADAGNGALYGGSFGTSAAPAAYLDWARTAVTGKHLSSCADGDLYSEGSGGPGPSQTRDWNTGMVFTLPCIDEWPYQLDSFEFLTPSSPTSVNKFPLMAWGAPYGFLGEQGYPNSMRGSDNYPSPGGNPVTINQDWHAKNYSTWVVLGQKKATDAVANQAAKLATIKGLAMTASVGAVATGGPLGIAFLNQAPPAGYPQTQSYSPAGYDPVFGALTFVAAPSNQLAATIEVNGGSLANPLIVLRGYTHGSYPAHILLDGSEQAADKNYFPSLRTAENQLWITLNSTLAAGAHTLTIMP
jgi:hypothetical protein